MTARFFDTNILVYLASGDPEKADKAESAVAEGGVISVQVLNELANVARRKMRMQWPEVRAFLEIVRNLLTVYPVTVATHEAGLEIAQRHRLSIYDSMIAAAAQEAGCDMLLSEDMHHGLVLGSGLRIINPFA